MIHTSVEHAIGNSLIPRSPYAIDDIISQIQSAGYIVTRQRRQIIEKVFSFGNIEDVETFWMYLRNEDICISLASIYSCLNLLTRLGILEKVHGSPRKIGYRFIRK